MEDAAAAIRDYAQKGYDLVISEALDELLALSDRIAVMFEGRIMGIVDRSAATRERIGLMMAGVDPDSEAADYCPAP